MNATKQWTCVCYCVRLSCITNDIGASSIEAQAGKSILRHPHLDDAPDPSNIKDVNSSVLGDAFHVLDRSKIPKVHEAKKSYKAAFSNALFIWNPVKLAMLERRMEEKGMSKGDIENTKFYNKKIYLDCVDRIIPSPKLLYWRVRAVFVMFGSMKDSKTGAPLFNEAAWAKANNLLKEILLGYYSDPPGVHMYTKKLKADGSVKMNKYDMEEIECMRGTNRVEAYHKHLIVTFGHFHTGVELSTVLLAERRHRHNHRCSERRRRGFPRIGHYDTWLIDQLQNLVRKNHNITLYPDWTNASDYKDTDESFDTVALHSAQLHDRLKHRCETLRLKTIKLTSEQRFIAKAMGTDLPFLPFTEKEEKELFSRFKAIIQTQDNDEAALWWCQYVDGVNIFPKLPVHFRVYREKWLNNRRARDCMNRAKSGADKLKELNEALVPSPPTANEASRNANDPAELSC